MKKMSTKKMKIEVVKFALLCFIFFFMGALNVNAQTAAELGADQTKAVLLNLRTAGGAFNADLANVKTGQVTGQDATNAKQAQRYYSGVMTAFIGGADLSQALETGLTHPSTGEPLSFLSTTEMEALQNQIAVIQEAKANAQSLNDFNTLFANSKNN